MIKSESLEYKFEANLKVVRIDMGSFSCDIPIYIFFCIPSLGLNEFLIVHHGCTLSSLIRIDESKQNIIIYFVGT